MTQTMYNTFFDSTIDDIHKIREEISDKFNGDIQAMIHDAQMRQESSGKETISYAELSKTDCK